MTVLTATVRDIAGADDRTRFLFFVPIVRGDGGTEVVTTRRYSASAVGGVLTTPDMEPGPAVLKLSGSATEYHITIPDSETPVQLWPLIEAATPPDNTAWTTGFVHNADGVARVQAVPQTEYGAMVKDPATLYFLYED